MARLLSDVVRDLWARQDALNIPRVSVFLCSKNKVPFYRRGHKYGGGHTSATTDNDVMLDMFDGFTAATNHIGIAGGSGCGIFVLDIDVKNPATPEQFRDTGQVEECIRIQYGDLPKTIEQITPSHGKHLFYKNPNVGTCNDFFIVKETGLACDIKGVGGYFVLYDYDVDFSEAADAPEWILEHFAEREKEKKEALKPGDVIKKGNRNNALASEAGRYWNLGGPPEELQCYLHGVNKLYCDPPLPDRDIDKIVQSAQDNFHRDYERNDVKEQTPLSEKIKTMSDLLSPQPPVEWIVKDFIAEENLSIVYGDSGSGKTWMMLHMMGCIAVGNDWMGKEVRQAPVLLIDEESGNNRLARRMQKIIPIMGGDETTPFYSISMAGVDLRDASVLFDIEKIIIENKIKLVCLDALMDLIPGADENSVKEILPAFSGLKKIIEKLGTTFVMIHHSKKDGGGYRGSSAIKGVVDTMIEIEKPLLSDIMKVAMTKNRDGEPGTFMAKMVFTDVSFHLEETTAQPEGPSTAEKFILRFLLENGRSLKKNVENQASCEGVRNIQRTWTKLLQSGIIEKVPDMKMKNNQAVMQIVVGKEDEVRTILEQNEVGNLENIM
jgi:hypothetical protein